MVEDVLNVRFQQIDLNEQKCLIKLIFFKLFQTFSFVLSIFSSFY